MAGSKARPAMNIFLSAKEKGRFLKRSTLDAKTLSSHRHGRGGAFGSGAGGAGAGGAGLSPSTDNSTSQSLQDLIFTSSSLSLSNSTGSLNSASRSNKSARFDMCLSLSSSFTCQWRVFLRLSARSIFLTIIKPLLGKKDGPEYGAHL